MNDVPPPEQPTVSQPAQAPPPAQGGYYAQPVFVPPGAQPPAGYVPYPAATTIDGPQKSNGYATASMIVSGGSLALLIFTAGIVGPITIIASIVGTVLGHKGRDDHRQGKTTQGHDEAVAGFWMGIAGIVLSILAVIAWVAVILFAVYYDDSNSVHTFHHGFELPPELQQ